MNSRRFAKRFARVLSDPFLIEPFAGIGIVGRKEMKFLGVDTWWMSKGTYVAGLKKIPLSETAFALQAHRSRFVDLPLTTT